MQNKRLFTIEMDFSAVDKPPIFLGTVKQLDGVTLKITPLAGYNPMTMIGVTPKLYAKKPNGEFVYQDVDIDVDLYTSQMTIQCKNFMFSDVGTVEMEIELYDDDNYLITSPTFEIDVTQKLNQLEMEDLKEGIHISLLEELMDYVAESKDYVERFKELLSEFGDDDTVMLENLIVVKTMLETLSSEVDRLENTITQAQEYEFEIANQEIARVDAEEKRVGAEALRVQGEANRVNEEAKRRITEQARVSAEEIRVQNEAERVQNEEERKIEEEKRISMYNVHLNDELRREQKHTEMVNTFNIKVEEVEEFVATKGQEVQNAINAIPPKSELIGAKGDKGDKGEKGVTPNITIGTVTTLESNQQASVTKRGTDTNPIFDFGIPKGEKGEGSTGGNTNTVLAKYVHSGNQEIHLTNFDISTGIFTCDAPHNLTKNTHVMPRLKANGKFQNIPKECLLSSGELTLVPQTSTTFTLNGITFNETNNDNVDVSKFYFECLKKQRLILDFKEEVKSINVRVYGTTSIGDLYTCAYYDGFFDKALNSVGGGTGAYQGATAMSSNATHSSPRYFNVFFNISIVGNLIVTNGNTTQIGFNANRTITNKSIAQISSVVEFFRDSFTGLCMGSRLHDWGYTNGLTIVVEKCGE